MISERIRELERSLDLSDPLHALEAHQERVSAQIALAQAILAPWRRVPLELWSEIFSYAPGDVWDVGPVDTRNLLLTEVCHVWRELALHIPQLWTSIVIEVWEDFEDGSGL